jgi:hypothetical protein
MSRQLAHIEEIVRVFPIPGADSIEAVQVLGWECVSKIGEFRPGDKCVYIEIDSIVPALPMFEFLKDRKYRIKTIKLRGQLSQGLALPLNDEVKGLIGRGELPVGHDVTELLKIEKYLRPSEREDEEDETPLPRSGMGRVAGFLYRWAWFRWLYGKVYPKPSKGFPAWVGKTDEERIQANSNRYLAAEGPLYVSEKVDGQSMTSVIERRHGLVKKHEFVVCSRNNRMGVGSKGSWRWVAEHENHESKMLDMLDDYPEVKGIAIQGENIGPGIQKNKYQREEYECYVFNIKFRKDGKTIPVGLDEMVRICNKYGFKHVPILDEKFKMKPTLEEMLKFADGKSVLANTIREGLVIRSHDQNLSFKVISNKYLLKESSEPEEE